MALTLAMPLSGLEAEHFYGLGVRFQYDRGVRSLNGMGPMSPSTGSESSGVSSLTPSIESMSSGLSRPDTPENGFVTLTPDDQEKPKLQVRVFYKERDILNLGANIRGSLWQLSSPSMPRYNYKMFMENRSIYYRLGDNGLTEEYQTSDKSEDAGALLKEKLAPIEGIFQTLSM